VPYVGTVVNGIINGGSVKTGDAVLLGPDSNGNYQSTAIKSMQRKRSGSLPPSVVADLEHNLENNNRVTVTTAEAGQCVSFALKRVRRAAVRKGMVIVNKTDTPPRGNSCYYYCCVTVLDNLPGIHQQLGGSRVKCSSCSTSYCS